MGNVIRRNVSGIYIFDKLEGDDKRYPTCIEDCSKEKRFKWLDSLEKDALISCVNMLCETLREVCDQFDIMVKDEEND